MEVPAHAFVYFITFLQSCRCPKCLTPGIRNAKIFKTFRVVTPMMKTIAYEDHKISLPLYARVCPPCRRSYCYRRIVHQRPNSVICSRNSERLSKYRLPTNLESSFNTIGIIYSNNSLVLYTNSIGIFQYRRLPKRLRFIH